MRSSERLTGILFLFLGMPLYRLIHHLIVNFFGTVGELSRVHEQFVSLMSAVVMLFIFHILSSLYDFKFHFQKISLKFSLYIFSIALIFTLMYDIISLSLDRQFIISIDSVSTGSLLSLCLYFFLTVILAPLIEEIFFRGFVWNSVGYYGGGMVLKVGISALSWAFLHGQYDLYDRTALIFLGVVLGVVRRGSQGFTKCLLLHGMMNFIAFLQAILFS